ncbi:MAG: transglycosylase family protein [Acidimicrobiales bacterium]
MLGDRHRPSASTRPEYSLEAEPPDAAPGSPFRKGLILAALALVAGVVVILPDDDAPSYSIASETGSGGSSASDAADPASSAARPSADALNADANLASDQDTAQLALATEAALAGAEHSDAHGRSVHSGALRMEAALQTATDVALADAARKLVESPPTTPAPTTTPPTTAAPTTVAPTTAAPTTTAPPEEPEPSEADPAPETETTVPETTDPETTSSETTPPETTTPETTPETTPPETTVPETTAPPADDGRVDAGHGVLVPAVLIAIRYCESTDNYTAANPRSSARGAYQFLTGSWAAYGHRDRYGVNQAHLATPAQQDEAALITWERDGTRPWNASKSCWSKRL